LSPRKNVVALDRDDEIDWPLGVAEVADEAAEGQEIASEQSAGVIAVPAPEELPMDSVAEDAVPEELPLTQPAEPSPHPAPNESSRRRMTSAPAAPVLRTPVTHGYGTRLSTR
jgi:hypothetical protein